MSAVSELVSGLHFGEGPHWHAGRLWFSDFYSHTVNSVSLAGDLRVELELDDQPSGLGWMPDGSLLVVKMQARQVWRRWPDGRLTLHADLSGIHKFLSNDMVVDGQGRAYVGDFGFDLHGDLRTRGPEAVLADHATTAIVRIDPDGSVQVAADGLHFPNGTVITPDGKTLICGETLAAQLTAFDVGADGALSNRRQWASTAPRIPDGICLDAEGAVWIANPLGPDCARIGAGGAVLDVVETGELNTFACMLGGPEGKHLFIMAAPTSDDETVSTQKLGRILVAEVGVPAAGWP